MNLYQLATDDLAYVSISATDIEGKSSGSVWKFPLPQMLEYNSEFRWSAEDLHQIASGVVNTLAGITENSIDNVEGHHGFHEAAFCDVLRYHIAFPYRSGNVR